MQDPHFKSVIAETLLSYKGMVLNDETIALLTADVQVSLELAASRSAWSPRQLEIPISLEKREEKLVLPRTAISSCCGSPRACSPVSSRPDASAVTPAQLGQLLWLHRRFVEELSIPWEGWLDHTERTKVWANEAAIVSGINAALIAAIVIPHLGRKRVVSLEAWKKLGEVVSRFSESMSTNERDTLIDIGKESLETLL